MSTQEQKTYSVLETQPVGPGVVTISLAMPEGGVPSYEAGQYITIYFPETGTPEGKSYTISSAPSESKFAITVKAMGEFSNRLCNLQVGDTVIASLPYGYFYSESKTSSLCCIAGGIGVTPFRSMIPEIIHAKPDRTLRLLYSARTEAELLFRSEFASLTETGLDFQIQYFVTRESTVALPVQARRLTAEDARGLLGEAADQEYLLCGSISFVRDLWRGLKALGVSEDRIYTETFF